MLSDQRSPQTILHFSHRFWHKGTSPNFNFLKVWCAGLSMGGTLQLLLELQFFIQATGHLSKNSQQKGNVLKQAKSALLNRVTRLATDLSSPSFSCLDEWCSSTGGTHSSYRADVVSNLKSLEIIEATRFNTASLKAWCSSRFSRGCHSSRPSSCLWADSVPL